MSTSDRFRSFFEARSFTPYYNTDFGDAYLGDSKELLSVIPDTSVSLVLTSPPFALRRKKNYGNVEAEEYVDWFREFANQVLRVLKEDGSFVVEIGGAWMPGHPTRSIYHYELLIDLVRNVGFHLAQEFFWFNPAKMPGPAQWVTVERIRCTDAVNTIWWLSKSERPKANNRRVLQPYSDSMKRLLKKGYNKGKRPSGHVVSNKWQKNHGGAIPKNLIAISNTSSNDDYQRACRNANIPLHPARFPLKLPEFFIDFLTDNSQDLIVDIFAGSNVTGHIAEQSNRQWLAFEMRQDFLEASKFRFGLPVNPITAGAEQNSEGTQVSSDK